MPKKLSPSVFSLALADWLIESGFDPFDPDADINGGDLVDAVMYQIRDVRPRHLKTLKFLHVHFEAERLTK